MESNTLLFISKYIQIATWSGQIVWGPYQGWCNMWRVALNPFLSLWTLMNWHGQRSVYHHPKRPQNCQGRPLQSPTVRTLDQADISSSWLNSTSSSLSSPPCLTAKTRLDLSVCLLLWTTLRHRQTFSTLSQASFDSGQDMSFTSEPLVLVVEA